MTPPDAGSAAPLDLDAALSDMRICLAFWKASGEMESRFRSSAFDNWKTVCAEVRRLRDRVTELEQLTRWSLGESPEGLPDFPSRPDNAGLYWWRIELRRLAGFENPHAIGMASGEGGAARRERHA